MNNEILTSGLRKEKELLLSGLNYTNLFEPSFSVIVYDNPSIKTMLTGSINSDIAKLNRVTIINANTEENFINSEHYNLRDCTSDEFWISNVESDCNIKEVINYNDDFMPIFNTGSYSIFDRLQRFFSSYSVNLLMDNNNSYTIANYKVLNCQAAIYKRDSKFNNYPFRIWETNIEHVYNSGTKSYDSTITVLDYDNNKKYPVVNSNNLSLPDNFGKAELDKYYEKYSKLENVPSFLIYTKYFPIKEGTLTIKKFVNGTVVNVNLNDLDINYNNGIIKIEFNEDSLSQDYYILYTATPRIDYEVLEFNQIRFDDKIKLRPKNSFYQTGALCINFSEKNINRIVLENSKNNVFVGSDMCELKATCYDSNDNTVSEIPVFFEFIEENIDGELGYLNNEITTFDQTNSDGIARCIYFAPYKEDSLKHNVTTINGASITFNTKNSNIIKDEVSLFFLRDSFLKNFGVDQLVLMYEYSPVKLKYSPTKPVILRYNSNNETLTATYFFSFGAIPNTSLFVFVPKIIRIRSYAIDPATSKKIYSNQIAIKLSFPYYLRGSFIDDEGFRFKKIGNIDFATGLGGSNYFSINKEQEQEVFKTIILRKD